MTAFLYLVILTLAGRALRRSFGPAAAAAKSPAPAVFLTLPADFLLGTIPFTTLNYFLAAAFDRILPERIYPLLPSNLITLVLALALVTAELLVSRRQPLQGDTRRAAGFSLSDFLKKLKPGYAFYLLGVLFFAVMAWLLNAYVLRSEHGFLGAGFSVFSDYAPHTAVVSSFAKGRNFPAEYPHFAGDGIQYHFFFYFLAGNLQYLGLGLAAALNLASMLGLLTFCSLFGWLAVRWSGRHAAFLLAPFLVFFRSSLAVWYWLRDVPRLALEAGETVLEYIRTNDIFIGRQPRDDWGLWNLNVYANQRHLLFGLAAGLLILICFMDLLPEVSAGTLKRWISREGWLPESWRPYIPVFLVLACLPYWHGSVTISVLLILAVMAVFSRAKAVHAAAAAISLGMALLYGRLFSGASGSGLAVSFFWGFISEDKSFFGVLTYLRELLGLSLVGILVLPWFQSSLVKKIISAGSILPLLFALTVSLTPDVTVNHKYIMFSQAFAAIWISDLLLMIWHFPGRFRQTQDSVTRIAQSLLRVTAPLLALLLTAVLTATGFVDLITYRNKNQHLFRIPEESSFITWLEEETDPDDVFLTAPWHYHPFFLSGRRAWYGHSYYAWSAGHDTQTRYDQTRWLFSGQASAEAVRSFCREHGIRYAIITDDLRNSPDYDLDEPFFQSSFELAATIPEQDGAAIYRIYD